MSFIRNRPHTERVAAAVCVALVLLSACGSSSDDTGSERASSSTPTFSHPRTIDNRYLPLTETRRCEKRGRATDGAATRSVTTVLDETKRFVVDGQRVDAVVIRDDAYEDRELVESTRDYFAQADDGTVYYLGEDVLNIRNGKVADTGGTWLYGRDTDVQGVAMPADPRVGDQYRFEDVPGITTESNRVEEEGLRVEIGGKLLTGVIRVQEFIQPEGEIEYKLYAPGVGNVAEYAPDDRSRLVSCS